MSDFSSVHTRVFDGPCGTIGVRFLFYFFCLHELFNTHFIFKTFRLHGLDTNEQQERETSVIRSYITMLLLLLLEVVIYCNNKKSDSVFYFHYQKVESRVTRLITIARTVGFRAVKSLIHVTHKITNTKWVYRILAIVSLTNFSYKTKIAFS